MNGACFIVIVCPIVLAANRDACADEAPIYVYTNEAGRRVFTNARDRVPPAARDNAKVVDLSHVSLNEALGADWRRVVEEDLHALRATPFCQRARTAVPKGWLASLWSDHGYLVLLALALLFLLVLTPKMTAMLPPGRWNQTLLWLLPLMAMVGVIAFAGVRTQRKLQRVSLTADLCSPASADAPAPTPENILQRWQQLITLYNIDATPP